jgi:putative tricarboxylic transport membrane protein
MKVHQQIGSIFWFIIGMYTAIKGYLLGLGNLRHPGPGFIFFVAALFLVILSAIDILGTSMRKADEDRDRKEHPWTGLRWKKVLMVAGILLAYICSFDFLGFFLSTFILMVLLFKGVEFNKWWIAILSSLITILISYGIFSVWLQVPFPTGIMGF